MVSHMSCKHVQTPTRPACATVIGHSSARMYPQLHAVTGTVDCKYVAVHDRSFQGPAITRVANSVQVSSYLDSSFACNATGTAPLHGHLMDV